MIAFNGQVFVVLQDSEASRVPRRWAGTMTCCCSTWSCSEDLSPGQNVLGRGSDPGVESAITNNRTNIMENHSQDLLDAQVDVLLDAEAEVSVLWEVLSPQLVLLHLQSSLQDLLGLNNTRVSCGKRKGMFLRHRIIKVYISVFGNFESLLSCERWLWASFKNNKKVGIISHLGSPHSAVHSDLLVPPDTETTNSVAGLGEHGSLSSERLQHLVVMG